MGLPVPPPLRSSCAAVVLPLYALLFARAGLRPRRLLGRLWLPVVIACAAGFRRLESATCDSDLPACISMAVTLIALGGLVHRDRTELRRLRGGTWATS